MSTTTERTKDKLIDDLKSLISDAEELLELTATDAKGKAADVHGRLGARLNLAKERLRDAEDAIVDSGRKAVRVTDDYVHDKPWQAVGIAAGVAFLLGLLSGRR